MRRIRRTITLLTAVGLLAAAPITAQAQGESSFLNLNIVKPGGTIEGFADKNIGGCLSTSITSPGFAAPMVLEMIMHGAYRGSTTVIMTPGTYTATKHCNQSGLTETMRFTILGAPSTQTPTTTPPTPGKPKPPVVKPRGAADTGGGGTA